MSGEKNSIDNNQAPDLFDMAIAAAEKEAVGNGDVVTTDELADIFMAEVFAGDGEVDIAKHLKRYHKHGLTENSHCKYIDKINKEKDSPEREDIDYATAKKKLWEDFGVETVRAKSIQDLEAIDFAPVDRGCFASQGKPTSDEAHEVAIKKFYKTCVDLKKRFPDFQLPMPLLVPWDFSKCSAIGRSTTDRRISLLDKATYKLLNISDDKEIMRECYIALGDLRILDGYTPNYKGADSDFSETIIRHEIGHILATKEVLEKWMAYKNNQFARFAAQGSEQAPILLKKFVVSSISEGAAENDEEAIAELFSIYANPAYKKGHLPKEVENIADFMLTQHKGKNMEELTTFDSRPEREGNVISGLPEWALRAMNYSTPMNPLYKEKPSQTSLAWWDQWDGKWHEFKTYDEMLCYVLNAYGFEKEHIEKISAALPKVKWTAMLLWEMREIYRHNDESVEEIIGQFSNDTAAAEDAFPDLFDEAIKAADKTVKGDTRMSENNIAEQGMLTESVIVDSGIIDMTPKVHPVTTDELADIFLQETMDNAEKKGEFDPSKFDQNPFEWGAIREINRIRKAVAAKPKKSGVSDEEFRELNRPFHEVARKYVKDNDFSPDKKWVKTTVLGVPKAFEIAFDVLSDGEGIDREYFLEIFTVEAICALATGEVDSIHEIERYYKKHHDYSVGRWVAFPCARLTGKVRQIIGEPEVHRDEDGIEEIKVYPLKSPDLPDDHHAKVIGLRLDYYRTFGTREEAQKYLEEEEERRHYAAKKIIKAEDAAFIAEDTMEKKEEEKTVKPITPDEMADLFETELDKEGDAEPEKGLEEEGMAEDGDIDAAHMADVFWRALDEGFLADMKTKMAENEEESEAISMDENPPQTQVPAPAQGQAQAPAQAPAKQNLPMIDRANLKRRVAERQSQMQGAAPAPEQAPAQEDKNPDVVEAQEVFKEIKSGDTFTDANGKKWTYVVSEFSVVPEDVKDEEIDYIAEEEPDISGESAAQDEATGLDAYTSPVPITPSKNAVEASAKRKARMTHRRNVAATWEDCKAKEKAKCPYHGAAYMTDQLKKVLESKKLPLTRFAIIQDDPERQQEAGSEKLKKYKMVFALPDDVAPNVAADVARAFYASMPNVMFREPSKLLGLSDARTDRSFRIESELEDPADMPLDAPTAEEENARRDTDLEAKHEIRARQRGAVSYAREDELFVPEYTRMLSEKPSNIVACNEDMMRYAMQFPEALPKGVSMEEVRKAYDQFKAANELKKGLRPFIVEGQVTDKAEALAEAAEMKMRKEGKAYREASEKVYDLADKVFNGVVDKLMEELKPISTEIRKFPTPDELMPDKDSLYVGSGYKSESGYLPLNLNCPQGELMRKLMMRYRNTYLGAREFAGFKVACEQREPIKAELGINAMKQYASQLKALIKDIGEVQDSIISDASDKWKAKYKIAATKKTASKTEEAESEKGKESIAKKEEQEKKAPAAESKLSADDESIRQAMMKDKTIQSLEKRRIEAFKKYGANSPEYKLYNDKAIEAAKEFVLKARAEKTKAKEEETPKKEIKAEKSAKTESAKPEDKTQDKPKSGKKQSKKATKKKVSEEAGSDLSKRYAALVEKGAKTKDGRTLDSMMQEGYGVYTNPDGRSIFVKKDAEGGIDTTKPYFGMESVHKLFGGDEKIEDFVMLLTNQERIIKEQKAKEPQKKDSSDEEFQRALWGDM